ncbi:MAG: hypothetical protein J2P41_07680 [Blastocatellia bacterium]|nr:hypothetical protein [Blastocatellia bacterium]
MVANGASGGEGIRIRDVLSDVVLPLVGWGMLWAAHYPIVPFGSLHFPEILPHNASLYAGLRRLHTILAYLFFLTFVAHFGAVLYHTLIVREGLLKTDGAPD